MPKKKQEKAKTSEPPPEPLPQDLPDDCPWKLSYRKTKDNRIVLFATMDQGSEGYCWTIVFSRMVSIHLYIHKKVKKLLNLSAKHLFANIEEKLDNGNLKSYKSLDAFLKNEGLVLEQECKCIVGKTEINSVQCDKVKDKETFKILDFVVVEGDKVNESDIIHLLNTKGPIAAHIRVNRNFKKSYKGNDTDEMYYGPSNKGQIDDHIILLTGYATKNGVHYFEYQNSWGSKWGLDDGFGKFARKISLPKNQKSLVVAYMYPEVFSKGMNTLHLPLVLRKTGPEAELNFECG
ncbi:unnamed protein product [Eruca vesicaria subsp. sativa]|uniref:Peptidase C1A papain C-terminal domain-containing protein n=1 Tax=Eruca vesicaria subsp. sativa TaxID=29727 RepID=A0ABC8JC98_ERUVS|nr:unnamed protein product [Eruca vesicaria subsp. sativa]